jgi:mannose-1-phosphate guanylyltransferase
MDTPKERQGGLWAILLAAGQGRRLRGMTTINDEAVPKQFCALRGNVSMLRGAIQRAAWVVPETHLRVVVAAEHAKWWRQELADLPPSCVLVQPRDRGTAAGILLPLTAILRQDPDATVLVLPADHYLEEEWILHLALEKSVALARAHPEQVVLLGMTPDSDRTSGYGWIVPQKRSLPFGAVPVRQFREKPDAVEEADLQSRGAMISSFLTVARGSTLQTLYRRQLPDLAGTFCRRRGGSRSLESLYERIPSHDFSRDLLERSVEQLMVVNVPHCGWADLGTPERVVRCLATHRESPAVAPALLHPKQGFSVPVDLSRSFAAAAP